MKVNDEGRVIEQGAAAEGYASFNLFADPNLTSVERASAMYNLVDQIRAGEVERGMIEPADFDSLESYQQAVEDRLATSGFIARVLAETGASEWELFSINGRDFGIQLHF